VILQLGNVNTAVNFGFLKDSEQTSQNFRQLALNQRTMTFILLSTPDTIRVECFNLLCPNERTFDNICRYRLDEQGRVFQNLPRYQRTIRNLLRLSNEISQQNHMSPQAFAFEFLIDQDQTIENFYLISERDRWYCVKKFRDLHEAFVSSLSFSSLGDSDSCAFIENFYRFLGYISYDGNLQIEFIKRIPREYSTLKLFSYLSLIESSNSSDFVVEDNFRAEFYLELSKRFSYQLIESSTKSDRETEISSIAFLINNLFRDDTRILAKKEFLKHISFYPGVVKDALHNQDKNENGEFLLSFSSRLIIACNVKSGEVKKDWLYESKNGEEKSKFDFLDTESKNQLEIILCGKLSITEINGYWFLECCDNYRTIQLLLLDKMFQYCMMTGETPILHKSTLKRFNGDPELQLSLIQSMNANDGTSSFSSRHFTSWFVLSDLRLYALTSYIRENIFYFEVFIDSVDPNFQFAMLLRLFMMPNTDISLISNIVDSLTNLSLLNRLIAFNDKCEQIINDNPNHTMLSNSRIQERIIQILLDKRETFQDFDTNKKVTAVAELSLD
jgi:hypothetical protein